MRPLLAGAPARDLGEGLAKGRFTFRAEQTPSMLAFVGSATLAAMWLVLVLDGAKTWREAGSDAAEATLRAIGATRRRPGRSPWPISRRFPEA